MALKLASTYGYRMRPERGYEIAGVLVSGLVLRGISRAVCGQVPRLAFVVKGLIGGFGTYGMGMALAALYARGLDYERMNEILGEAFSGGAHGRPPRCHGGAASGRRRLERRRGGGLCCCLRPLRRGRGEGLIVRVAYENRFAEIEPLLAKVEKPSRYLNHEWGTRSHADADYRACLIYPDTYEVGLPNQGIAILYAALNQAAGISCERGYIPWVDMADAMRAAHVPLLSLEGAAPVASFDIVGFHIPHEMAVTNFLEGLDLAGIPLMAEDRGEDDPIVVAGGPSVYNPEPYAAFFDALLIGEGEESIVEVCERHRELRDAGGLARRDSPRAR